MTIYHGVWISPSELKREIIVGDMVMIETLGDTLVVEVSKLHEGELWHHNNWIIPRRQIVAIKQK